jgi:hypothetical protein
MAWNVLDDLSDGDDVLEVHLDEIRENIEWLGDVEINGAALKDTDTFELTRMAQGSYTGDGTSDRNITGVGFQPRYVFVHRNDGVSGTVAYRTTQHATVSAPFVNSAPFATLVRGLASDGFSVGNSTHVNESAAAYIWVAFS